ncbi:phospholipid/cholesterol/gamma-HCH transport system substrate-binding protein [Chitinophaga jiangningensis]|uniref:Phospholipid/cholesterol/gamma-HCH transport system substrate-binding protein n=1 Tax=Chitinophaga jiangningensis TaxID=1419482 RepID=A0A1M6ZVZ4_9BACT|nr:MlaD family protein [Chitinophaga jiangningensis]SHL34503.1 phospholipid/cholesterol/gamma-HCH transport system substrate-binding protein [Chitinophaga jiangningensis]
MKDTSNRRSVIVGIFILIGVLIFIAAILTLGGQKKAFVSAIRVKAIFKDVNGLAEGNNVWYSGVKVGTVKKITFVRHDEILVEMNVEKSAAKYIHKDVAVKVSSDGFVGNKIIALTGGTDKVPDIEDGDQLQVETTVGADEIMNTLQVNNKSLVEITSNLKVITKKMMDGEGTVGKLLTDDALYNELQGTIAALQKTAGNTQRLTEGLSAYAAKLQTPGSLSNDLVSDTVVFAHLRSTMRQLDEVAANANTMVESLKSTTNGLNQNLNSSNTPAGVLLSDKPTAEALKSTMQNLQSTSVKLDENMEALKHNFLLRGYFRKQEKRARKEAAKQAKDSARAAQ